MVNKTDIISNVAAATDFSKKDVEQIIKAFQDAVICDVSEGKEVSLSGFIKFQPKDVAARERLIPSTGQKAMCPAHRVVKIKPLKGFKDIIAG